MAIGVGNSSVCLEDVLGRISEIDILSYYCGITKIPCVIHSPLREDNTPSFGFYTSDGKRIHWIDYATNDRGGTFDLLMKMWNCSYAECLDRVYNDILMRDLEIFNNKPLNIDTTRNPYRCGLGTGSASIGYDGKIFGCQEQDSRDTNDYFYIGDIYSGIDIEKHSQILKDYEEKGIMFCENKEKCENCVLRRICIHDNCPSVAYDMFKDFKIRPEIDCEWHKMLFEDALIVMNMMKQENNELFKQYLDSCFSISPKKEKEEY